MKIYKHIPNTITMLNLVSGCIGISIALTGRLYEASYFIGIAALFDFLDGFTARLLNVRSEIGKQLDSLADVVSFGLLPGMIIFMMMMNSANLPDSGFLNQNPLPFLAFLIPVFSALRLAKFNLDTRQSNSFLGLPTPASAILLGSLPLISQFNAFAGSQLIHQLTNNYFILLILVLLVCGLLVSEIPLFALKFKNFKWQDNKAPFLLIAISVFLIAVLGFAGIPCVILSYIILSLFFR